MHHAPIIFFLYVHLLMKLLMSMWQLETSQETLCVFGQAASDCRGDVCATQALTHLKTIPFRSMIGNCS